MVEFIHLFFSYDLIYTKMDILNKMRVPELKSVLREYKKVHYQPYSKLNREGLIKLIVSHKLHENDLSKHIKVKVITKKKTPPKKDENKPKIDIKKKNEMLLKYYEKELEKFIFDLKFGIQGIGKKFRIPDRIFKSQAMDKFNKYNSKIEEITGHKKIIRGINEPLAEMRKRNREEKKALKNPYYTKEERDIMDKRDKERQKIKSPLFFI